MKPSHTINIPQYLANEVGRERRGFCTRRRRARRHFPDGPALPSRLHHSSPPDLPAISQLFSGHWYHFIIFAVFLSVLRIAQAEDKPNSYAGYNLAARAAATLDENFYNPFKLTARQAALPLSAQLTLTNEQIAQLLGKRKVQGLIFGTDGVTGKRAIIGDEVFAVGDEIAFYDNDYVITRLSSAGIVRSVRITRESLEFEISVSGQPSRRMDYSLSSFFTP
jgi:hypothetical protein